MMRAPTERPAPQRIIRMSFQLAIPWRAALQRARLRFTSRPHLGGIQTQLWGRLFRKDCFENWNRLKTETQSTQGWVNDHENPWVNDGENPQLVEPERVDGPAL
jgi:hypothetical protein